MHIIANNNNDRIPSEKAIRNNLIKSVLDGYACNNIERLLFPLPMKYEGLGINTTTRCYTKNTHVFLSKILRH